MRLDFGPLNRSFKARFLFCDEIWVGNFFHVEIEFIRLDLYIESYKLNLCDVSIHVEITIRVGATWKPSLRDSVSNRNFFKNWNSTFGAQSTLCHLVSLSRLPCPISVTQSSLSRLPSTLSSHASPSTLCHASVTALRHSASVTVPRHPHSSLTLIALTLTVSTCQVWFCDCVICSFGFVIFVPKLRISCVTLFDFIVLVFYKK